MRQRDSARYVAYVQAFRILEPKKSLQLTRNVFSPDAFLYTQNFKNLLCWRWYFLLSYSDHFSTAWSNIFSQSFKAQSREIVWKFWE